MQIYITCGQVNLTYTSICSSQFKVLIVFFLFLLILHGFLHCLNYIYILKVFTIKNISYYTKSDFIKFKINHLVINIFVILIFIYYFFKKNTIIEKLKHF